MAGIFIRYWRLRRFTEHALCGVALKFGQGIKLGITAYIGKLCVGVF
ncbi:Putative protein [Zobellia galactanivorans]|uniref:Uncharacterized protein n=1 Tax=Zobellia galactanivorans (strain DSM 12802 / CCUG 47099 / CIP 106680 / NCIMB 13871 / Dsij) TaxID=63186 RepID=G0L3J2_ZOBGA|nr:Putative protein [Zobellia galactanivorans]